MRTEPCPKCSTLLLLDEDLIQCASCGALLKVLTVDPPTLLSDSRALELISEASPGDGADMRRPLPRQDVRSPDVHEDHVGDDDDDFIEWDEEPEEQPLNRWWKLLETAIFVGGFGILLISKEALDKLFHITISFWPAAIVSHLPIIIFSLTKTPDFHPHGIVRFAHWFAAVWYLIFATLALLLMVPFMAYHGFEAAYFFFAGLILLGAWACLAVLRRL